MSPRTNAFEVLARERATAATKERSLMKTDAGTRFLICCRPLRGLVESNLFVDLGFRCAPPQGGVPGRASRLGCETLCCRPLSRTG